MTTEEAAKKWDEDGGEHTLRVDFPLTPDSIVYDVGGCTGEWSQEIADKYNPHLFIFEPIQYLYDGLVERFKDNPKVSIFHWGLLDREFDTKITKLAEQSSLYTPAPEEERESVWMRDVSKFPVPTLISMNVEGAEYAILQRMIDTGWVTYCQYVQVQFHEFPNCNRLRNELRRRLSETHDEMYCYPFVWEAWSKR